jgi:hypothetical protein
LRHESCHASSEHKYTFILPIVLCIFLAEIEVVAIVIDHIGVVFIGFTICEIYTADIASSEAMIETDRLSV